jgi:hypothetical protein
MEKPLKLISDKYRKARGGYSRLLNLSCEGCGKYICDYQKDGPGPLKRIYLDRILNIGKLKIAGKIVCPSCDRWLGVKSFYKKENRPCVILFQSVIKKSIKRI